MAIKIRYQMPETNSSSSHSLTIYKNDPNKPKMTLKLLLDDSVMIPNYTEYDFGWGWDLTNDPGIRACYVISCIVGLFNGKKLLSKKQEFEKVIMDYTGAKSVKYEWEEKTKIDPSYSESERRKAFITFAPTVDHQSISEMYREISLTEDSMRDFIFSNQSTLLIGGEDTYPYSILTKVFPEVNYKVKVVFDMPGNPVIPYQEWPGGESVRSGIDDFANYVYFDVIKGIFRSKTEELPKKGDYSLYRIFFSENLIRFYKNPLGEDNMSYFYRDNGINDDFEYRDHQIDENDYKELKFEIIRS